MVLFKKASPKATPIGQRKRNIPAGLWSKCPECEAVIFSKTLKENYSVCTKCDYHFVVGAWDRVNYLVDKGSFHEHYKKLKPIDSLGFKGAKTYLEKYKQDVKRTGLKEACIVGEAAIEKRKVAVGATDSRFIMGSMGSVVGEKLTRLIEDAIDKKMAVIIVSASGGGARMYEGMLSLMQMAKTSAALRRLHDAGLPFISVLTDPTMGGVMASYASLGDIILAEPRALLGFAGPRVIAQTIRQKLPDDFQTSEFLLEHGMVDKVVPRSELKPIIHKFLNYFLN